MDATRTRQRNRRGEGSKLRAMILDAAQAILTRTGSESELTIRAVTREAGIAPQSFYLQFASLSELLFALYEAGYERLHARMEQAAQHAGAETDRLAALCRAYLDFASENPGAYANLTGTVGLVHADWNADELPGASSFALLRDAIAGSRPGLVRDDRELHVATTLLWAQLHGIAVLRINRPTFPWPPVQVMITELVRNVGGAHS